MLAAISKEAALAAISEEAALAAAKAEAKDKLATAKAKVRPSACASMAIMSNSFSFSGNILLGITGQMGTA
jgi:hypothetical protein